jgi:5-deoxy-glucuronate isomerase
MTWFYRNGGLAQSDWDCVVDRSIEGWSYTGLRVGRVTQGDALELSAADLERVVIPLAGSFSLVVEQSEEESRWELEGRESPFRGPTDVLYLPVGASATITGSGRVAVAEGPATQVKPIRHVRATEVPLELRGAGRTTRQVHNFATPETLDADRLIVCEVITPSENWSSYPSHKHDTYEPGSESQLEEIYYFEVAQGRDFDAVKSSDPVGFFRNYGTDVRPIDTLVEVRSGDVALVPHGWHGPAMAVPGYDLYYLNVMAGPDPERAWNISFDPNHAWVKDSWAAQEADSRLPYGPEGK